MLDPDPHKVNAEPKDWLPDRFLEIKIENVIKIF
jgi:hypothetical protein